MPPHARPPRNAAPSSYTHRRFAERTDFKSTAMSTANDTIPTGPSFAAALCGFLSTTAATTMLMLLVRSF
ncbi:hypothetical protein MGN01_25130 [Methylobacterium gnaphalii]|uniref:Uncharacterized protein n=1 Tax=Methylobacterium gnaphalii TaxID=1010610 RepID=A0A512JL33_9HYPH|nr:hypothetical protein MGN01_25130 [Methylobacterium gnaphalii]GLS47260.1 hypothetical protein GCM10007885_01040 [Methylobacterium gnaphalii]